MNAYDTATQLIRAKGLRVTKARAKILSAYIEQKRPLSIADFKHCPELSELDESSIYRNITKLEQSQLIRSIPSSTEFQLHELNINGHFEHHHHITCTQCKKIQCLNDCSVDAKLKKMAKKAGFQIEGHTLELYGRCSDCTQ